MEQVCAWCGEMIGEVPDASAELLPPGTEQVSHGICSSCVVRHFGHCPEVVAGLLKGRGR